MMNISHNKSRLFNKTFLKRWNHFQVKNNNVAFVIYLRIDKSYTIYLKLISIFPNSQITVT